MFIPAPPPLNRFGNNGYSAILGLVDEHAHHFRQICRRCADRTGKTSHSFAGKRIDMKPASNLRAEGVTLVFVCWLVLDPVVFQDEARRYFFGQPRGLDRELTTIDETEMTPLKRQMIISGLEPLTVTLIIACIAAGIAIAALLIPPLFDLAGYLVMGDDYVELQQDGGDAVSTPGVDFGVYLPGMIGLNVNSRSTNRGGKTNDRDDSVSPENVPPPLPRLKAPGPSPALAGAAVGGLALIAGAPLALTAAGAAGAAVAANAYRERAFKRKRQELEKSAEK